MHHEIIAVELYTNSNAGYYFKLLTFLQIFLIK